MEKGIYGKSVDSSDKKTIIGKAPGGKPVAKVYPGETESAINQIIEEGEPMSNTVKLAIAGAVGAVLVSLVAYGVLSGKSTPTNPAGDKPAGVEDTGGKNPHIKDRSTASETQNTTNNTTNTAKAPEEKTTERKRVAVPPVVKNKDGETVDTSLSAVRVGSLDIRDLAGQPRYSLKAALIHISRGRIGAACYQLLEVMRANGYTEYEIENAVDAMTALFKIGVRTDKIVIKDDSIIIYEPVDKQIFERKINDKSAKFVELKQ